MNKKYDHVPNQIADFVDERDIFGQIKTSGTGYHKASKPFHNGAYSGLKVQYASIGVRIIAFILDLIIVFTFLLVLDMTGKIFNIFINHDALQVIISVALIWLLYNGIFESSKYQATIGKMILRIKVVDIQGRRLHFLKALLREIFTIFSILPLGFGVWAIEGNSVKQGWHDKLSDCYVIKS